MTAEAKDQRATVADLYLKCLAYETGELTDEDEILEFFQGLVDTGLAWSLQGHYGRAAKALLDAGHISRH